MSHTTEPWDIVHEQDGCVLIVQKGYGEEASVEVARCMHPRRLNHDANATRIVSCINGCAGLNPAAFRECMETLQFVVDTIGETSDIAKVCQQAIAHAQKPT